MSERIESLTKEQAGRLRFLLTRLKPPRITEEESAELVDLESQLKAYVLQEVTDELVPLIESLQSQVVDLEDLEGYEQKFMLSPIPEHTSAQFARLPDLFNECDTQRSAVSALARRYARAADSADGAVELMRALFCSLSAGDGPQWRVDAEFTVTAKPLIVLRDEIAAAAAWCKSLSDAVSKRGMTLHALKDLANS